MKKERTHEALSFTGSGERHQLPLFLETIPQDLRTISSHLNKTSRGGKSGLAILSSMTANAILPRSRHGWCRVVRGTGNSRAYFTSSIPTMRMSFGIRQPSDIRVCIRSPAVISLAQTKASGLSFFMMDLTNFASEASPIVTKSRPGFPG